MDNLKRSVIFFVSIGLALLVLTVCALLVTNGIKTNNILHQSAGPAAQAEVTSNSM